MHLARAVAASAMEDLAQLGSLVEDNLAQYFDLKLKTDQKIASLDPHAGCHELIHLPNISSETQRA